MRCLVIEKHMDIVCYVGKVRVRSIFFFFFFWILKDWGGGACQLLQRLVWIFCARKIHVVSSWWPFCVTPTREFRHELPNTTAQAQLHTIIWDAIAQYLASNQSQSDTPKG